MYLLGTIKDISKLDFTQVSTHIYLLIALMIMLFGASSPIILHYLRTRKENSKEDLKNHYFFQLINYTINCKIDQFNFNDAFKNKVFKQLLRSKFELLVHNAILIINAEKGKQITSIEEALYFILNQTRDELSVRLRDMFRYNEQTVNVLGQSVKVGEYVESQFLKRWDVRNYECMLTHFRQIAQSNIYDNNHERIDAALNVLTAEVEIINLTVEQGLREINGLFKHIRI